MKRPLKWTNDTTLTVTPKTYGMGWLHRFICDSILGKNEIKQVKLIQDFLKLTGHSGMAVFDEHIIYVAYDVVLEERYIALFHEIFHYYFRDYDGAPNETRAENSAQNLLKWYKGNKSFYEFKCLFNEIEVGYLTNEELDLL